MVNLLGTPRAWQALIVGLALCFGAESLALADPPKIAETPASGDASTPVPQESLLSSLGQAFKQDFDREAVRGHFDVGSPPDVRRYYCLVDIKTGKRQPNGVPGQPMKRPDGMTGIKATAVSLYTCDSAEQQGILITSGYVLIGRASAGAVTAPVVQKQTQAQTQIQSQPPAPAAAPAFPGISPDRIDVAGVKLGMPLDEVRAVFKSKNLLDYHESTEALGHVGSASTTTAGSGHFVNVIAAWTPAQAAAGGGLSAEDGESYEVMFTPVPGRERVMAIVHTTAYSPANAVRETTLKNALIKKYGGFAGAADLPQSPTWRIQSGGNVQVGDTCNRRGIFGGLGELHGGSVTRSNLALKTTPEEFQYQIDSCGVAIVTEDHETANGTAPAGDRTIARFTVTAYSPSIGFDGATTAAQLMQRARDAVNRDNAPRTKDTAAPNL